MNSNNKYRNPFMYRIIIIFFMAFCTKYTYALENVVSSLENKLQEFGITIDAELMGHIKQFDIAYSSNCLNSHDYSIEIYHNFVDEFGEYSYEVECLCNALGSLYKTCLDINIGNVYTFNACLIDNIRTSKNGIANFTRDYHVLAFNPFGDSFKDRLSLFHKLLYQSLHLFGINGTTAGISRQLGSFYLEKKNYSSAYYFACQARDWYNIINSPYNFAYEKYLTNEIIAECKKKASKNNIDYYYSVSMRRADFSSDSKNARKSFVTAFENSNNIRIGDAIVLNEYGIDCYMDGNFSEAIHYLKKACNILSDLNISSSNYPLSIRSLQVTNLLTLAEVYSQLSDINSASLCYERIIANDHYTLSDCNTSTLFALLQLYNLKNEAGKSISALKDLNEAKRIYNNVERLNIDVLPDLGFEYTSSKDGVDSFAFLIKSLFIKRLINSKLYDKAISDIDMVLSNSSSNLKNTPLYNDLIIDLARCYYLKGQYTTSLKKLLSINKTVASNINTSNINQYLDYLLLVAECNYSLEKFETVNSTCQIALDVLEDFFSKNILTMPGNHQFSLWHSVDPFLSKINTLLFKSTESYPNSINTLAHLSLLSKGILFYSDSYIKHNVANCPDQRIKELYELICQEKSNSNNESSELLTSYEAEFFSNQFVKNLLANWNKNNSYNLSEFSSLLKNNEIFIDFVQDYRVKDNSQSNLYANYLHALLITNRGALKDIPLCCEDEITFDIRNHTLSSNYNAEIWDSLQKELSNYETIYFSPCGVLHSLPLENAISSENSLQGKRMVRLSTIRELAKNRTNGNNVEIFGDIRYSNNNQYDENRGGDIQSIIKYGLNDLRYSRPEINNITSIIRTSGLFHINHKPFSGTFASEEAFKNLNGTDVNILHISSHAIYIPSNNNATLSESNSLSNSFIALSDFNTGIKAYPNAHGNDGILTAWELSSMYFPQLNFVSISTCQSGLGDTNNEGVFGLQRGFKKAGAETMLISLWKVDDHATHLLMSEFYKQWMLNHKDKHEALKLAQQYVYNYSNPEEGVEYDYKDPYFWSGFVLLDAL